MPVRSRGRRRVSRWGFCGRSGSRRVRPRARRPLGHRPARAAATSKRASVSARPRLTTSSRIRSRSVHAAEGLGDLRSSPSNVLTERSSSSAPGVEGRVRARAFSIAIAAQSASTTTAFSSSFVELAPSVLLGQVEVAVGLAADQDRDAEEGLHRRVAEREAVRPRMLRRRRRVAAAAGSLISTPRTPRPRGRSPIARGSPRRCRRSGSARAPHACSSSTPTAA